MNTDEGRQGNPRPVMRKAGSEESTHWVFFCFFLPSLFPAFLVTGLDPRLSAFIRG
jgi:hypothetical protein